MELKFRSTFKAGSYNMALKNTDEYKFSEKSGS